MTVFEKKQKFLAKIADNETFDVHCMQFVDCDNEVGYKCVSFSTKMNFDMIKSNIRANHSLIIWADDIFNFRYASVKGQNAIELNRLSDDFIDYYKL